MALSEYALGRLGYTGEGDIPGVYDVDQGRRVYETLVSQDPSGKSLAKTLFPQYANAIEQSGVGFNLAAVEKYANANLTDNPLLSPSYTFPHMKEFLSPGSQDPAELRQLEQNILANHRHMGPGKDDGFGAVLGLVALAAAVYAGGAGFGAWGAAEGAAAGAGGAMDMGVGLSAGGEGMFALAADASPSLLDRVAAQLTPEKLATRAATNAITNVVQGAIAPEPGLIQQPSRYGFSGARAAAPAGAVTNEVPLSFATALSPFQPKFARTA